MTVRGSLLVVDDEESVAVTLQALLEMDGYSVAVANSGREAFSMLRQQTFDAVLSDYRLDDLDGLAILAEARRLSPATGTILMTGYASSPSMVEQLRLGASEVLIKPIEVEHLRAAVARGVAHRPP